MTDFTSALVAAPLAVLVGYAAGKMPCWKSWQGYVGLMIVAPLAVEVGIPFIEAVLDVLALGVGFAFSRRLRH